MDEQKIARVRAATLATLARQFTRKKSQPTVEGNTGRSQALLLTAATLYAATEDAGNDPRMFEDMANAALDAFDETIRRHRRERN